MMLKKRNRFFELMKITIIPFMIMIIIAFYISTLLNFPNGNLKIPLGVEVAIPNYLIKLFAFLFMLMLEIIGLNIINKNKEFLAKNGYGDWWYGYYKINYWFFGQHKLNMKHVPIYNQVEVQKEGLFDIVVNDLDCPDGSVEYLVEDLNNLQLDSFNLIIGDTYPIEIEQLPKDKQKNIGVIIKRKDYKNESRVFDENLISIVEKHMSDIKKKNIPINIFWTTNPKTIKHLMSKVFLTSGGDRYVLNIYQQERDSNRAFKRFHRVVIK